MKKMGFFILAIHLGTMVNNAQNWQNLKPEELAKRQTDLINEKCGLDKDQEKKVYDLSLETSIKLAKISEEVQVGGGQSDDIRARLTKIREELNMGMKNILTADQHLKYEKYLEERRVAKQGGELIFEKEKTPEQVISEQGKKFRVIKSTIDEYIDKPTIIYGWCQLGYYFNGKYDESSLWYCIEIFDVENEKLYVYVDKAEEENRNIYDILKSGEKVPMSWIVNCPSYRYSVHAGPQFEGLSWRELEKK